MHVMYMCVSCCSSLLVETLPHILYIYKLRCPHVFGQVACCCSHGKVRLLQPSPPNGWFGHVSKVVGNWCGCPGCLSDGPWNLEIRNLRRSEGCTMKNLHLVCIVVTLFVFSICFILVCPFAFQVAVFLGRMKRIWSYPSCRITINGYRNGLFEAMRCFVKSPGGHEGLDGELRSGIDHGYCSRNKKWRSGCGLF